MANDASGSNRSAKQKPRIDDIPTSRPTFFEQVTLNTVYANRVYKRCYAALSRKFYTIDIPLRVQKQNQDIADRTEVLVTEELAKTRKIIRGERERIDIVRNTAACRVIPVYDNPQTINVAIKSPMDAVFLRMICELDELVMRLNGLRMVGEITAKVNTELPYQWQQDLIKCSGRIIRDTNQILSEAKNRGTVTVDIDVDDVVSPESLEVPELDPVATPVEQAAAQAPDTTATENHGKRRRASGGQDTRPNAASPATAIAT